MNTAVPFLVLLLLVVRLPLTSCKGAEPPVTDVTFSRDGHSLVACSQAGIQIFDWPELTKRQFVRVKADNLHDLAFSSDGSLLAVAAGNPAEVGIAVVYSWPDLRIVATNNHEADSFSSVAWINKDQLVFGCMDRSVVQLDLVTQKVIRTFTGHSKSVQSIAVLPGNSVLVTAGVDHSLRVWNAETGELARSLNQHSQPVRHLAVKPTSNGLPMLASASQDQTVRFWQPTIGRMVRSVRLNSAPLKVAWVNDSFLATACADGSVRIIDVATVKVRKQFESLEGWAFAIAVHPISSDLVVAGENGQIERIPHADFSEALLVP